jgi:purine-binding chemotaxis protein CheW
MNNLTEETDFELDFSSLLDLQSAAPPVPSFEPSSPAEGEKYVVFHLDEKLYAVHSAQVAEVIGSLAVTALPFVSAWLAGIANLRGDIISVVDLRKLWKKTTAPESKSKLLVLRSPKGSNHRAAFIVDKLNEIVTLKSRDIEFSAADFASSFPTFFGRARHKTQTLYLLDAENLFASLTLTDDLKVKV